MGRTLPEYASGMCRKYISAFRGNPSRIFRDFPNKSPNPAHLHNCTADRGIVYQSGLPAEQEVLNELCHGICWHLCKGNCLLYVHLDTGKIVDIRLVINVIVINRSWSILMAKEELGEGKWKADLETALPKFFQAARSSVQSAVQGAQSSIANAATKFKPNAAEESSIVQLDEPAQVQESAQADYLEEQLKLWRKNPSWVDERAVTEVSVPKGTLCHLDSTFKIGLPPEAVFGIITDPENKRVFKNIQEVKYRKVIKAEGSRQLVEVEQSAVWKFLWLSGTIDISVFVDEDHSSHTLSYKLAKTGFMKKFEGSWVVQPLYVDGDGDSPSNSGRVASLVRLQQEVQPVLVPPPPISWYIRGITTKTTEMMIEDLQAEGKRIREGMPTRDENCKDKEPQLVSEVEPQQSGGVTLKKNSKLSKKNSAWASHTGSENSRWHIKK